MKNLARLTIAGDALFILWILYNAVDERGQGIHMVEAAALSGLVVLLVLNILLLLKRR